MTTIPQGYKDSKVGIIPEDWDVVTISSQFDFLKTYSNSRSDLEIDGKIQYLHYGDIHTKYKYHLDFNKNELPKLSPSKIKGEPIFVKDGDVLIADASEDYNDIGKSVEVKNINDKKVISGLHTFLLRDKEHNFINGYKGLILYNKNVAKEIKRIATGISVLGISKTNLGKLYIPKPSMKEQEKIAQILTKWAEAIVKQESLIKEKEQLKKGLMQKLLSGEKRFDEFDDEWEEIQLSKILKERKQYSEKGLEHEHVSLTKKGVVPKSDRYERDQLVKDENKKYKITKLNDICYNPANLKFGVICKNTYGEAIFSPIYVTFEVNEMYSNNFMGYFLTQNDFIGRVRKFEEGTVYERMAVNPKDFLSYKIKIPSLLEQNKIVGILSFVDKEIELLNQELKELKQQKKGLMQNLLTGKVRVKV